MAPDKEVDENYELAVLASDLYKYILQVKYTVHKLLKSSGYIVWIFLLMARWVVMKLIGIKIRMYTLILAEWTHACQKRSDIITKNLKNHGHIFVIFFYFILYIALVMISIDQPLF